MLLRNGALDRCDGGGTFPADKNTLVAYRYWYDPARRWEYPAVLRGNKLVTTLKDAALADPESFQIKILSSNRNNFREDLKLGSQLTVKQQVIKFQKLLPRFTILAQNSS